MSQVSSLQTKHAKVIAFYLEGSVIFTQNRIINAESEKFDKRFGCEMCTNAHKQSEYIDRKNKVTIFMYLISYPNGTKFTVAPWN